MKDRRNFGRILCLALAALLVLAGCKSDPNWVYVDYSVPRNDGQPAKLTIGPIDAQPWGHWLTANGELQGALEEIIAKYEADYPNTEIEVLTSEEYDGHADITVIDQGTATPPEEWLLDLSGYADAWEKSGRLCKTSQSIMHFMTGDGIYAIPLQYAQLMVFYRDDWFEAYNEGQVYWKDKAAVDTWERYMNISSMEHSGTAVATGDLPELFQAILWSDLMPSNYIMAAACYAPPRVGGTIFSHEQAPEAISIYQKVLDHWVDTSDPVGAFMGGEAAVMIISPTAEDYRRLSQMPEGSWKSAALPCCKDRTSNVVPMEWTAWAVQADTQEPEKAVHFLAYLTNPDNNTHMVKEGVASPIYKDVTMLEPGLLEEPRGVEIDLVNSTCLYADLPRFMGDQEIEAGLWLYSLWFADGELTGEEMLAALDRFYLDRMELYREQGGIPPWEREKEDKK